MALALSRPWRSNTPLHLRCGGGAQVRRKRGRRRGGFVLVLVVIRGRGGARGPQGKGQGQGQEINAPSTPTVLSHLPGNFKIQGAFSLTNGRSHDRSALGLRIWFDLAAPVPMVYG